MQSVVGVAMVPEAILEKLEPMNTFEGNFTTKDHHYSVVKMNLGDVYYHRVVKINTILADHPTMVGYS